MCPDPQGAPVVRSYSLSGPPGDAQYRISVKQEPHGVGSSYLHQHVAVGAVLDVAAPRGTFTLDKDEAAIVLLSAGVGATPVLAMLHALAGNRDPRAVWWVHGARDGTEHPFADEARALLSRLPGGRRHVAYSRPRDDDRPGDDYTSTGRLTPQLLETLGIPGDANAYICGPVAFMDDMTKTLVGCGLKPARIHTETFGSVTAITPGVVPTGASAPHLPAHPPRPGTGASVSFARSGLVVPWEPGYGTLLELAEACDVPVRWSCRTGVCHTCETAVVSGRVDYSPDPIDLPAEGSALICCSQPPADITLDL
jgi:ferredoxin-NADP reductase